MKWKHTKKNIAELKEYANNPRQLSEETEGHLYESLSKFGSCEPIVINTDGTIIGGHQRCRVLKKLGYTEVDVYLPEHDLTEKEVQELNIRLNKNVGDWDFDILANSWEVPDLLDWGFTLDDLGIDSKPAKEKKKNPKLTITFESFEQWQGVQHQIQPILDAHESLKYQLKI